MKIDEGNLFGVGRRGNDVVQMRAKSPLSPEEAANLAAWLLVLSGCPKADFDKAVKAIEST